MAITNVTSGNALATTTTTLGLVAPTVLYADIMLAIIHTNDNTAVSGAGAGWNLIRADDNTAAQRGSLYWKRAAAGDSGSTNNFTVAGTTVAYGVITAWRGCVQDRNPIGNTTVSANASADAITYATLTPLTTAGAIVAIGLYADDLTTAGGITGTDPTFASIVDVETTTGNDASIMVDWGVFTGIATGARSQTTTSTADAVNIGYLVELIAHVPAGGVRSTQVTYPKIARTSRF